ncbi:MAG TPA: hypothetical protein PLS50_07870 [Candidatus Dojkabacteria bacterium]|nr:hypothetical protein [Candidatus Dojkabacteria bacterium]
MKKFSTTEISESYTREGRIRYLTTSGTPLYDYFVKDHLGNVRMVLTDEKDTSKYPMATLESANIATERVLYSGIDSGRVNKSTISGYPADGTTSPNDYIQQLRGNGFPIAIGIGSGILLKVMTGEAVAIRVSSWYNTNGALAGLAISSGFYVTEKLYDGVRYGISEISKFSSNCQEQ